MRVRVKTVTEGPGPSEAVVAVKTAANGEEEIVVQKNQISNETLQVWPIEKRGSSVLVELPQESASGNWRLWIDRHEVE